ncbi:MAG: DUF5996 family protein [Microthrixaceae bacterium]
MPVDIPGAIPFPDDDVDASYDPDLVRLFCFHWLRSSGCSRSSVRGSWGSPARSTSSGERSTWPRHDSPEEALRHPYELVRSADDPDQLLLEFLQSTYEAAAVTAGWDRDALERDMDNPHG